MTTPIATNAMHRSGLRRLSGALYRRPRLVLAVLLAPPVLWLVVIYLGSLALMFVSSLWRLDPTTSAIVREPSLANFRDVLSPDKPYLQVAQHTVGIAAMVTIIDSILAFPLAYYMARVASPRARNLLVVAVLMPLWASYLVKAYAWRTILDRKSVV